MSASRIVENPRGGYRFLTGFGPFSAGCAAEHGFEIVRAVFPQPQPLEAGYERIAEHLGSIGRPMQALSGIELRIPKPLSFADFVAFNRPYVSRLAAWDLLVGDLVPPARSNLAPVAPPVDGPSIHAFSYTVPSRDGRPTFVVSGAPEIRFLPGGKTEVVAPGDVSPAGLHEKAAFVVEALGAALAALGVSWEETTAVEIYCAHDVGAALTATVFPALGSAARHGVRLHRARPPVEGLEFEADVRGVRREVLL